MNNINNKLENEIKKLKKDNIIKKHENEIEKSKNGLKQKINEFEIITPEKVKEMKNKQNEIDK